MVLEFDYVNYKGEKSHRFVRVEGTRFGASPWHQEPQWLMKGYDRTKGEYREFAIRDMTNVKEVL